MSNNQFKLNKTFLLAGNAVFTAANPSNEHYTYKVTGRTVGKHVKSTIYFIGLLTGPNNEHDYTYLGMLDPSKGYVSLTRSSKLRDESKPVKVVRWVVNNIYKGKNFPQGYKVCHAGKCGRCGRMLTTPQSVELGFGPDCAELLGLR